MGIPRVDGTAAFFFTIACIKILTYFIITARFLQPYLFFVVPYSPPRSSDALTMSAKLRKSYLYLFNFPLEL